MLRRSRFLRVGLASAGLFALPLALATLLGACDDGATTGSKRVALATEITADAEATTEFINAYGWTIHLTKAVISVGPLYYFNGATIFSSNTPPPPRRAFPWLGVGAAWAHPGHYRPGDAMGQVLEASSADLLAGTTALPDGEGVAGVYRSGRFIFGSPPKGGAAAALEGHVVVVEGEATKDGQSRYFRAVADVDDVLDAEDEPRLEGCAFEGEPDVQSDGTVTIHVKPRVWLDQADFSDVPEGEGDAPVTLTEDLEAHRAFTRGLKKGSAVVFTYQPG